MWVSRNSSQHQMFDFSKIKTKVNQQWDFLESSSLCASTTVWTRIQISANLQTDILQGKDTCTKKKKNYYHDLFHKIHSRHSHTHVQKKPLNPDHFNSPSHDIKEQKRNRFDHWALVCGQSASSPLGRRGASSWSRLFKQSPVHRFITAATGSSQLYVGIWRRQRKRENVCVVSFEAHTSDAGVCLLRVFGTCALLLCCVVHFLLDSGLQAFNLLVVIAPLGHDPHRSLQLGLLGHGVVTLRPGKMRGNKQNHQLWCSQAVQGEIITVFLLKAILLLRVVITRQVTRTGCIL